ncbi:hypothetical protein [Breoghania sp.]|uniref:hypothetical protein n=1 Tax=Breoghania sp. TaxID=2065378 RepID=UPI0026044585|nr:hypothetical protein [Breoghania sp.]MDJ0929509.1 hypothetical protein [Breoghania sp.]
MYATRNESAQTSAQGNKPADTRSPPADGQYVQAYSEEARFSNPYAVLDKLSDSVPATAAAGISSEKVGFGVKVDKGGHAYRDPFDPLYWQFTPQGEKEDEGRAKIRKVVASEMSADAKTSDAVETKAQPGEPRCKPNPDLLLQLAAKDAAVAGEAGGSGADTMTPGGTAQGTGNVVTAKTAEASGRVVGQGVGKGAGNGLVGASDTDTGTKVGADETARRLKLQLAAIAGGPLGKVAARLTVEQSDEGLLINLTDDKNFGMFAIGSAEPLPQLVKLMEEIGKTLSASRGKVIIRDHTDARPFHSRTYDNWRLSTARAHIAYYMLMRGGFDPKCVERVEGYADHDLKVPSDLPLRPQTAASRSCSRETRHDLRISPFCPKDARPAGDADRLLAGGRTWLLRRRHGKGNAGTLRDGAHAAIAAGADGVRQQLGAGRAARVAEIDAGRVRECRS